MSLVPSLLNAILRLDGEALVMHVGEKPYVVAPTGQVELASRPLNLDAVSGMVSQLLPAELQRALDEFGAVQYEFPKSADFAGEHFSVVAARGGDDIWVEVRRRRVPDDDYVPEEFFAQPARTHTHGVDESLHVDEHGAGPWALPADEAKPPHVFAAEGTPVVADLEMRAPESGSVAAEPTMDLVRDEEPDALIELSLDAESPVHPGPPRAPAREAGPAEPLGQPSVDIPRRPIEVARDSEPAALPAPESEPIRADISAPSAPLTPPPIAERHAAEAAALTDGTIRAPVVPDVPEPAAAAASAEERPAPPPLAVVSGFVRSASPHPGVVLPMGRNPIRPDSPATVSPETAGLDRLLRIAAARGASTLYLTSQARPFIRIDGEIQSVSGEAPLSPGDVESLLIDLMPERNREELRSGIATEWICDLAGVGRIRCMTFRDHRGAGGIFRMMPIHAISADQLGLSREIQALAAEPEGLVLVAGPRSSGKSTLVSAFVDLINRTRRDHVITVESEIKVVHEQRSSLVSQREVRGSADELLAVTRAAIRENPDVLVIEDLRSAGMVDVALEAAGSGHLVIGALPAHTSTGAVDRIIDLYPPERRRHVQLSLAETLRGIVAQVLLRKPGGGRVAAREVLLNTPAVASVIAEGKTSQLPLAIEGGRKYGMVPLNDALVGLVQAGSVDAREAYRRAADRVAFLALLKRQGVDTSFVERLA